MIGPCLFLWGEAKKISVVRTGVKKAAHAAEFLSRYLLLSSQLLCTTTGLLIGRESLDMRHDPVKRRLKTEPLKV